MPKILPIIKKRRSIRSYSGQEVSREQLETILKAAMFAPSANHQRQWQFTVVQQPDLINKLGEMKPWSEHVAQASAVIVITSNPTRHWLEDAAIVGAHIYLQTTALGLGTCWTQVYESQTHDGDSAEDYVKDLLDIDDGQHVLCLMPVGYPAQQKSEHQESEYEPSKVHWI